jgi:hypothetical protein
VLLLRALSGGDLVARCHRANRGARTATGQPVPGLRARQGLVMAQPQGAALAVTVVIGGYELAGGVGGLWFLVDPATDRIASTFWHVGEGVWLGKSPRGPYTVKESIGDAEEPQEEMARRLVL